MAQSTTNLGKIHVFPSETLYNQFKGIIADNDLALLKDDGAYIVAALLGQNGYVKFSNGLILQWGYTNNSASGVTTINYHIPYSLVAMTYTTNHTSANSYSAVNINNCTLKSFDVHARAYNNGNLIFTNDAFNWLSIGK
ncbi:gp53-like domain-containing protein [Phascolarctobacterium succinatutens]|uniref:gp53-like domain-containing protein n=1 Tax=Phascolarctobacterium succinatutens TaxID=626940 RepID=UPI003AF65FBC